MEDMDDKIDTYIGLFDHCIEGKELPSQWATDPIAVYIKEICQAPGNIELCKNNEAWREIFQKEICSMLLFMLPWISKFEKECKQEMSLAKTFFNKSLEEKRKMWYEIANHLNEAFDNELFNILGYVQEFGKKEKSVDEIFEAMRSNWEQASQQKLEMKIKELLDRGKFQLENRLVNDVEEDFRETKMITEIYHKFPVLQEIANAMGRNKEIKKEMNATMTKYIPILLKHSHDKQDIDGVTLGNHLNSVLPSEIAMMDSSSFYIKLARKQLQQFSSKAAQTKEDKSDSSQKKPRLEQGPMIICLDTSGSMYGKPLKIAQSLVRKLATIAKKEKRSCFLISFAVRIQTLDLSKPSNFLKIESFFEKRYTGGTDGEEMLNKIIEQLQTSPYSMADALIVSDFEFDLPSETTMRKIKEEQNKGTRFYGLRIDGTSDYDNVLDKVWKIRSKSSLKPK